MSLIDEGKRIRCDGTACGAVIAAPVALRPSPLPPTCALPSPAGWLFVLKHNRAIHFCPDCARCYLESQRIGSSN